MSPTDTYGEDVERVRIPEAEQEPPLRRFIARWRPAALMARVTGIIRSAVLNTHARGETLLSESEIRRANAMIAAVENGPENVHPGRRWHAISEENIDQLIYIGFDQFKRTAALDYFTFVNLPPWHRQFRYFAKTLPAGVLLDTLWRSFTSKSDAFYSRISFWQSRVNRMVSLCAWRIARMKVTNPALLALSEPELGGAFPIVDETGRAISADLANTLIECATIDNLKPLSAFERVLDFGAGYGRTGYAVLTLNPGVRYVVVDISPALWIAERYLTTLFPDRATFRWRRFEDFETVRDEFMAAHIAFLSADQMRLLPNDLFDLAITIASLHDMPPVQIHVSLTEITRHLKAGGLLYSKQRERSANHQDGVKVRKADYAPPPDLEPVLAQRAPIQTDFFEQVYRKRGTPEPGH